MQMIIKNPSPKRQVFFNNGSGGRIRSIREDILGWQEAF